MTSTNIGTYSRDVTSDPSPLPSLLGPIGAGRAKHGCVVWTVPNQRPASLSQSVSVAQRGAVAAFECSHKTDRKADCSAGILWFWTWHCRLKSWLLQLWSCSSWLPSSNTLASSRMEISRLPQETKGPQISLLSTFFLMPCGCILSKKKKTVTPRCRRKMLYKGKCCFI